MSCYRKMSRVVLYLHAHVHRIFTYNSDWLKLDKFLGLKRERERKKAEKREREWKSSWEKKREAEIEKKGKDNVI